MTKTKLSIFIDSIFISFFSFLIFFYWSKRYIKSVILIYFISISLSLILYFVLITYLTKKYKLSALSFAKSKKMDFYNDYFKSSPISLLDEYLTKLFSCKKVDTYIYKNNKYIFYINFRKTLSENDYFEFFDKFAKNKNDFVFISQLQDESFLKLSKSNEKVSAFSFAQFYKFIEETDNFPVPYTQVKKSLKQKYNISSIKSTFNKTNFKNFFISGASLLLISFFIPFSFYYATFGSFLLILSFLCLTCKNKPMASTQNGKVDLTTLAKEKEL